MARQPHTVGGRYELTEQIGAGGMGQVFAGYDRNLDRPVAVKLTRADLDPDPEWTRRFLREARLMARLIHPGLPTIHDAGIEPGTPERPYLVMELIQGVTLDRLAEYPSQLPVGVVASIGAQIAAVLAAAHRQSVYHRDLKPSNVMMCPDGTVKVLDFGLAVLLDKDATRITSTGKTLGTPAYMAPEQVNAEPVVAQTDLYSLGLVLYELLGGAPVMTGSTPYLLWKAQTEVVPPQINTIRPDVPRDVGALLADMLAKDARRRPADADTVHRTLLRHVSALDDLRDVREPQSPARMYAQASVSVPGYRSAATLIASPIDIAYAAPVVRSGVGDTVVERLQLADRNFDAGHFESAADLYRTVGDELSAANGPYDEQAMYCHQRLAICQLRLGNAKAALNRLKRLHQQMSVRFGTQDKRVIDLATQINGISTGGSR
ncbi:serine/threonine-protein kinase [Nocardia camponoti]|uniref:non-specific serine/threonine protein kinase n=1 Tax=Nocardia camponoti TaxID=1616106 RepID=A0A917VE39_9NOCA|nr:serine/threonine-protein kinase [Nocardia camponoti]GGK66783.1 hypothetical protein GCM10011591_43660 [Nocardia camponoti]